MNTPKNIPKFVWAILLIVSMIPAVIICDNTFFAVGVWVMYMMAIGGIAMLIKNKLDAPKKNLELEIKFYQECKENKITDLSSEPNKQKALLIAQKLNCKYTNIEEFFEKAKKTCIDAETEEKAKEERAKLASLQKEETERYNSLVKYASFYGRDKRIAVLTDTKTEYLKQAQTLRKGMDAVIRGSQQKEINWATHGGIASGLAGGAAGLAVAADAQMKNAQIRAQNEANLNALAPGVLAVNDSARKYEEEAKKIQLSIDDAKIKLVTNTPKEEVFRKLKIFKYSVDISETGAFSVEATVGLTEECTIFDNLPAVIDGTLTASLYQNDCCVGSALLVLPTFGIGEKATLEGICLNGATKNIPYELKFSPYLLWEMEA